MIILNLVIAITALAITIFVLYHVFFLLYYVFCRIRPCDPKETSNDTRLNRFAIIVPAYNEEMIIQRLIDSVKKLDYPKDKYELLIIVDNCNDKTEAIVRKEGVTCYVRNDETRRGKPFALAFVFQEIDLDKYDAFNIIDADTTVDEHYLNAMNRKINDGAHAIQGYFGIMNPDDTWLTRLMVIPGILKFKIRYSSKNRLTLSCPLMGNGMCFSQHLIKKYGWNAFSVTENWEYYIMLSLNNYIVTYAENAVIYSHAVKTLSHGEPQRKRWLKGRLGVLAKYYKTLILRGIKEKRLYLWDVLVELALPSYSMLFMYSIILLFMVTVLQFAQSSSTLFFWWVVVLVFIQTLFCVVGLVIAKAPLTTWLMLGYVPIFLLWKLTVSIKAVIERNKTSWDKTEREL